MIMNRTPVIGLKEVAAYVKNECDRAKIYRKTGYAPKSAIVHLTKGQGRTTVLNYLAVAFRNAGVLPYVNGLDDFIELHFSGGYDDYKLGEAQIDGASVYGPYDGVIGLDATELAKHRNETHWNEFIGSVREWAKKACLVFYVPESCSKTDEDFIRAIRNALETQVTEIVCSPYDASDYAGIVAANLEKNNISIDNPVVFLEKLQALFIEAKVSSIAQAMAFVDKLIDYVDVDGDCPTLKAADIDVTKINGGGI